jgi:hypothetical protein
VVAQLQGRGDCSYCKGGAPPDKLQVTAPILGAPRQRKELAATAHDKDRRVTVTAVARQTCTYCAKERQLLHGTDKMQLLHNRDKNCMNYLRRG